MKTGTRFRQDVKIPALPDRFFKKGKWIKEIWLMTKPKHAKGG
jgi:hypothetical protein